MDQADREAGQRSVRLRHDEAALAGSELFAENRT